MTRAAIIGAVSALWIVTQANAQPACRQALALGLDVSGSVDLREYRLQIDGLVTALNDEEVVRKLLAMPQAPVALLIYEWSGPEDQAILVPWTYMTDRTVLRAVSASLAATERRNATPGTALGVAMMLGARFLAEKENCWKHTLDISGDGKSNFGPRPRDVKTALSTRGIVINGLVIGADAPAGPDRRQSDIAELSAYFQDEVILGQEAFVQTAIGYEDYADAMTRKLRRELEGLVIGRLQ